MKYNRLGTTGMYVSEICRGTMAFSPATTEGRYNEISGLRERSVIPLDPLADQSVPPPASMADRTCWGG